MPDETTPTPMLATSTFASAMSAPTLPAESAGAPQMRNFDLINKFLLEPSFIRCLYIFMFPADNNVQTQIGKVVVSRNTKHAYSEAKGCRSHITAQICCSAAGLMLPPMLIFEKKLSIW